MNAPRVILICCEGKETEPQYFEAVKAQYRISQGAAEVQIIGNLGQHEKLIDKSIAHRNEFAKKHDLAHDEIELWAVCDKDNMTNRYDDLLAYATKFGVNLAFCDPAFEVFLLQHFGFSATNENGRALDALLTKNIGKKYDKTDISWFADMIRQKPRSLFGVIAQCDNVADPENTPLITVHRLVRRLLDIAPKA